MLERPRRALRLLRQDAPRQAPIGGRRERGTPPNVVGKGPLPSAPGLRLGIVVIVRNEAPYLPEWLAYHHALGVEHVFLYDNGSTDELAGVIEPWVNHGLATVLHWPLPGGQIDAYSHAIRFFGPSLEWLAFIDVDEFIVPLVDDDIPAVLARFPDAADLRVPRKDFGFSGHRTPPGGLTIEAYNGVANVFGRDPAKAPRVKTIARPASVSAVGIHTATVADVLEDAQGRPVKGQTVGAACHAYVQLNHYYTRSFEEFEAKRFRGSATGRIARPAIDFDLPTLEIDTSAQRFAERTRAVLERMASLDPSPYRYGSELRLAQFPRFNDLGLFSEFAFANVLAEEPEPRREPRLRLENRYEGIGFVADIAGIGVTPGRASLSGTVHLAPLVERTRGRLEVGWSGGEESPAASLRAGRVEEAADGWRLEPEAGQLSVGFMVRSAGRLRCYAVGFVVSIDAMTSLHLSLSRDGRPVGVALDVPLDVATTYAGVVEIDAQPLAVDRVDVTVSGGDGPIVVHDLFVLSYG